MFLSQRWADEPDCGIRCRDAAAKPDAGFSRSTGWPRGPRSRRN